MCESSDDTIFEQFQKLNANSASITIEQFQALTGLPYDVLKDKLFSLAAKDYIDCTNISYLMEYNEEVPSKGKCLLSCGKYFSLWEKEMMKKKEQPALHQEINIGGDVNGPLHTGTGNINLTITEQDGDALVEIITMLINQHTPPSHTFLDEIHKILKAGYNGIELLKKLAALKK